MASAVRVGSSTGHATARGATGRGVPVPGTTSGYGATRSDSVGYMPPSPKNYSENMQRAFGGGPKAFANQLNTAEKEIS